VNSLSVKSVKSVVPLPLVAVMPHCALFAFWRLKFIADCEAPNPRLTMANRHEDREKYAGSRTVPI
jgi:hypothetical protein